MYGGDHAMAGPKTLVWHVVMLDSLSYAASCGRDNGRIGPRPDPDVLESSNQSPDVLESSNQVTP